MKKFLSILCMAVFLVSLMYVSEAQAEKMPRDIGTLLRMNGDSIENYDSISIVPVHLHAEGSMRDKKLSGQAIQLVKEYTDGSVDVAVMVMTDEKYGIADVNRSGRSLITFDYQWDPITSLVTTYICKYYSNPGIDGHAYYRPYQLTIHVVSGSSSALSSIAFITAGYKITGALYQYPTCINTASPIALNTNSELHVNCVYNNPTSGGYHTGTNNITTKAIQDTGAQGVLGLGVKYKNGTKETYDLQNVYPYGTTTMPQN